MATVLHEAGLIEQLAGPEREKIFSLINAVIAEAEEHGSSLGEIGEAYVDAYLENKDGIEEDDPGYGKRLLFCLVMMRSADLAGLAIGALQKEDPTIDLVQAVDLTTFDIARLEEALSLSS